MRVGGLLRREPEEARECGGGGADDWMMFELPERKTHDDVERCLRGHPSSSSHPLPHLPPPVGEMRARRMSGSVTKDGDAEDEE